MKYEIGAKIRYFRELRGLNQKELGKLIGVSNTRISNWEQGVNRPDADTLVLLCQALEVSADELLDMNVSNMSLTTDEKQIVINYRNRPDLQHAIRVMLGIADSKDIAPIQAINEYYKDVVAAHGSTGKLDKEQREIIEEAKALKNYLKE